MSGDPGSGADLIQALGLDAGRHDRDLLWDLVRRLDRDPDGGSLDDLVRDLVLDPSVDPVLD
jgi:hypothetical protein